MYPGEFDYHRPASLAEAVSLMDSLGSGAVMMAGGQSLIPLMKLRLSNPEVVVDISRVDGLSQVSVDGGRMRVGALVRHVELEDGRHGLPPGADLVREAAYGIGDRQVRNLGTLGGALAEADPTGDWGPVVLALDGAITAIGPGGERRIAADDLFVGPYASSLEHGEIIRGIELTVPTGAGSCYLKLERRAGSFAIASIALWVVLEADALRACGIGLGGVGLTPVRPAAAERLLAGRAVDDLPVREAAVAIQDDISPVDDVRGGSDYKRSLIEPMLRRALDIAVSRARSATERG